MLGKCYIKIFNAQVLSLSSPSPLLPIFCRLQDKGPLTAYWLLGKRGADGFPKHVTEQAEQSLAEAEGVTGVEGGEESDAAGERNEFLPCNFGKFGTFEITRDQRLRARFSVDDHQVPEMANEGESTAMADARTRSISMSIPRNRFWSPSRETVELGQVAGQSPASGATMGTMTSRVREDAPEVGEGTMERPGLGETEGDRPGRGGREGEGGGMDEMMYDSVGAVTAMEREGKEDLLHACMAQAEYDKKGTLQD